MRTATFFAVMLLSILFTANTGTASASAISLDPNKKSASVDNIMAIIEPANTAEEKKPEPAKHTVAQDETLSDIADQHDTNWKRLFYKNTNITDPNFIKIGQEVTIPLPDEELVTRELPEPPAPAADQDTAPAPAYEPAVEGTQTASAPPQQTYTSNAPRGSSAGNTYSYGYCTWYAKNMRPDLPNNLGNADTWVARASAQGIPTGSAPRAGAIGQQGMHVVYVQRVNSDGTVLVSEMNYQGFGVVSSRTVPASHFRYIY